MRTGGQTKKVDGVKWWLVLTESRQNDAKEWIHSCGKAIQGKTIIWSHQKRSFETTDA